MPIYRGVLHVHSTLSDGDLSPEAIRDRAQGEGLSFVVLCEHANYLLPDRFDEAVQECKRLSDESFLMILGLEFEYRGRHILALGPTEALRAADAETVGGRPQEFRARGGLTIWAHPACTYSWSLREGIRADYDGWEVWNRAFDGPVPNLPMLAALRKRRSQGRPLLALGGADFHRHAHKLAPVVQMKARSLTESRFLATLEMVCRTREGRLPRELFVRPGDGLSWLGISAAAYAAGRYGAVRARCILARAKAAVVGWGAK